MANKALQSDVSAFGGAAAELGRWAFLLEGFL